MKGIIFDFNGTMLQDSHIHEQAWLDILKNYSDRTLTEEEILTGIHGRTNDKILKHFLEEVSEEEISTYSSEKEAHYRELLQEASDAKLTAGVMPLLNELKERKVPITIATASPKVNVDFYLDYYNLTQWFTPEQIVHDDGSFPGKPEPDIFIKAAENLKLKPNQCIVIEDAYSGLLAAERAGIGKIIFIDPDKKNRYFLREKGVKPDHVIEDFVDFLDIYF